MKTIALAATVTALAGPVDSLSEQGVRAIVKRREQK
jgi:hypothetical protein